jgi:hypothetical protein
VSVAPGSTTDSDDREAIDRELITATQQLQDICLERIFSVAGLLKNACA